MLLAFGMVVVGLALLAVGADKLVQGAVALARRLGVSPLVIGLTVVAFGTSLPELLVSLRAALDGAPGLAVGNVVGSNIANILLILGAAAVITPLSCARTTLMRDGGAVLLASLGLVLVGLTAGIIDRPIGIAAVALLLGYIAMTYWMERGQADSIHAEEAQEVEDVKGGLPVILLYVIGGLAGLAIGAELLVRGAVTIAEAAGVPEEVIGLTLVAFGTSVPELATVVAAALKRQVGVILGNVLGSNLFNILAILGITAIVVPVEIPAKIVAVDQWIMLAVTVFLFPALMTGWRLVRWEGGVFLALYAGFIAWQFV